MGDVAAFLKEKLEQRCSSMTAAFRMLDKSNTGFISPADFEECCRGFNLRLTRQTLVALIAKYDRNGDGYVSYEEFSAAMTGYPPGYSLANAAPVGAPVARVERAEAALRRVLYAESTSLTDAFLKLDRDRSGSISPDELFRAFTLANINLSAQELAMIVAKYDVNRDGKLDLYELAKLLPTGGPLGGGHIARGQQVGQKRVR